MAVTSEQERGQRGRAGAKRDSATWVGIFMALGMFVGGISLTSAPLAFINVPSLLIVVGGTLGTVIAGSTWDELRSSLAAIRGITDRAHHSSGILATQILDIAIAARQRGLLQMQDTIETMSIHPLFQRGLQMAVDGSSDREIAEIINREIETSVEQRDHSARILRRASELAPAMGLLGTLIGLVQMLTQLDDPSSIGPSMAVALLTTFYGIMLANLFFIPLSNKLEQIGYRQEVMARMALIAALSIQRRDNPRRLEMQFNAELPPSEQVSYFR